MLELNFTDFLLIPSYIAENLLGIKDQTCFSMH